jgi:SAM-dependent methyltransferase
MPLIPSRVRLEEFAREAAASLPPGALVLDAGAGKGPYRPCFAGARYESADFCKLPREYPEITYVCDLTRIPVEESRFDLVFCSQVLEHVPEPAQVLREFHRVLKPGGSLWLSAPLFYEEHNAPYDFFRYTRYGFTHLLQGAGFELVDLRWLEGYCATLSHQLGGAARFLPRRPDDFGGGAIGVGAALVAGLSRPWLRLAAAALARLDLRHKIENTGLCINYRAVARRAPAP